MKVILEEYSNHRITHIDLPEAYVLSLNNEDIITLKPTNSDEPMEFYR